MQCVPAQTASGIIPRPPVAPRKPSRVPTSPTALLTALVTLSTLSATAQPIYSGMFAVEPGTTQTTRPLGRVSVSGDAQVRLTPDRITLQFGLQETGPKVPDLANKMTANGRKLVSVLKDAGVQERHIQTDDLQISIEYNDTNRPSSGVRAYTATRNYSVQLTTSTLVETVMLAALTEGGAVTMAGPDYALDNPRRVRDEARRMAIRAAREKAELMASGLGRKVGQALSINESGGGIVYGSGLRSRWGGYGYGNAMMQNAIQDTGSGGSSSEDEGLPMGQIGISATVHVTFEME